MSLKPADFSQLGLIYHQVFPANMAFIKVGEHGTYRLYPAKAVGRRALPALIFILIGSIKCNSSEICCLWIPMT